MIFDEPTAPPQVLLRGIVPRVDAPAASTAATTTAPAVRSLGLLVFAGNSLIDVVALGGDRVTVGRDPSCTICVNDSAVSRRHCSVHWRGGDVELVDEGSSNGTFRGGRRVERVRLQEGDEITVGLVVLRLVDLSLPPWTNPADGFARLYVDAASGVLNRRGLRLRVDACCSVLPAGTPFGVMMLGAPGAHIDAELAARIGRAMTDVLPVSAYAARIDATRFCAAIFALDAQQQLALAGRLREAFERRRPLPSAAPGRAALDIGLASGHTSAAGQRALFGLADEALDRARAGVAAGCVQLIAQADGSEPA